MARAIGARKEAQAASDAKFKDLFDNAPIGYHELDAHGRFTRVNRTELAMLGYREEEFLGHCPWEFVVEEVSKDAVAAKLTGRVPLGAFERTLKRKDGSELPVLIEERLIHNADGTVQGIRTAIVDNSARKRAEADLAAANQRLTEWVAQLERRTGEMKQLGELVELLQSCRSVDEACQVIERVAFRLFPGTAGAVYLLRSSQNLLQSTATWGSLTSEAQFGPDECWALRRGRTYGLGHGAPGAGMPCEHLTSEPNGGSLCVPMMARGEAVGLLHVTLPASSPIEGLEQLVNMVAESIGLAIANLRLHESLQHQSIRDPLTGLFNRRYMEESFQREIRRAARAQQPVAVVMLDLDHFKQFNDTYGHSAGDRILKEVGQILQTHSRGEDIACRYGGEEFTLILPGMSAAQGAIYADALRMHVAQLRIEHRGEVLGRITLSAGVVAYPSHGDTAEHLLGVADPALYRAKAEGRNRVCVDEGCAGPARPLDLRDMRAVSAT